MYNLIAENCPLLRHGMPLKDRLWKFQKRRRIHFFLIEFSIFSRINSAAKIFPLPTSHTHITPCLPSLPSSPPPLLLPSLCAIKWNIHETVKDYQIFSYRPCLIAESSWERRCQFPVPNSSHQIQQPDWIPSLTANTLAHSHTHIHTLSHT